MIASLSYSNAKRATAKGLSQIVWILYTIIAFAIGLFAGSSILFLILSIKNPIVGTFVKNNDQNGLNQFMANALTNNLLLYSALLFAGGFGGYLLVRYLIEKKPDLNTTL